MTSVGAAIVFAVAACSVTKGYDQTIGPNVETTSTTIASPRGYRTFTDSAFRFSISVPSSWQNADTSGTNGERLKVVDPTANAGFYPNVNVIALDGFPNAPDLPTFEAEARSRLEQDGFTVLGINPAVVAGQSGFQAMLVQTATGLMETQYEVFANGFFYVVTLAGVSPDLATIESSFTLLP